MDGPLGHQSLKDKKGDSKAKRAPAFVCSYEGGRYEWVLPACETTSSDTPNA